MSRGDFKGEFKTDFQAPEELEVVGLGLEEEDCSITLRCSEGGVSSLRVFCCHSVIAGLIALVRRD